MEKRKQITEFLSKIEKDEAGVIVLSEDAHILGGDASKINAKECYSNGSCSNYGGASACGKSNYICVNESSCSPRNFDCHNGGGGHLNSQLTCGGGTNLTVNC